MFITNNEHFLETGFLQIFSAGDQRLSHWIWLKDTVRHFYIPYKYKSTSETTTTEYSNILRLAEQYLIRSEARIMQGDIVNAMFDLDVVRSRAGLPLISDVNPSIGQQALLDSIVIERQREFFTESLV